MVIIETKTVKQSEVIIGGVMQPNQANIAGNVHGGEIMKLMDNVAGIVAAKHARSNVVTARVDKLEFHYPIKIGNLVTCQAKLSFVGNSSMEVFVKVLVEDVTKEASAKVVSTAFFTMVALDEYGKPMTVPSLEITSDEESDLFDEGKKRYLTHKQELNK